MKVAILSANLGEFDKPVDSMLSQYFYGANGKLHCGIDNVDELKFHRFTDEDFPAITGLTPRLQYRIPKLFGWEMLPNYDIYLWFDSSMAIQHMGSAEWFLDKLGDADCAFFTHPWRKTIKQEVEHIEDHLQRNKSYIVSRYKNGLHREFLNLVEKTDYVDDHLFASTAFIYRNNEKMRDAMQLWWYYQSRYFTCDQVQLPYALWEANVKVNTIQEDIFKSEYISLVSHHK